MLIEVKLSRWSEHRAESSADDRNCQPRIVLSAASTRPQTAVPAAICSPIPPPDRSVRPTTTNATKTVASVRFASLMLIDPGSVAGASKPHQRGRSNLFCENFQDVRSTGGNVHQIDPPHIVGAGSTRRVRDPARGETARCDERSDIVFRRRRCTTCRAETRSGRRATSWNDGRRAVLCRRCDRRGLSSGSRLSLESRSEESHSRPHCESL